MANLEQSKIITRIPRKARDWLFSRAHQNRRTMTAELVLIIEAAMSAETQKETQE